MNDLRAIFLFTLLAVVCVVPVGLATDLPPDFVRNSLILNMHSGELGLYRIEPRKPGPFRAFTRIDVAMVEHAIGDPHQWVIDRVSGETAAVAEAALVLFDPDNPYAGARVNDEELSPESVHRTLDLVAQQPHHFCDGPTESYNDTGTTIEIDCAFWLAGTSTHLLVRLQQAGDTWYLIIARAHNSRRFRQLSAIADSLRF